MKERKLTKLDQKVVDYLRKDCLRLKTAYKSIKKEQPSNSEEKFHQLYKLVELSAQIHNLSTVADVVYEMFLVGPGVIMADDDE